MERTTDAQVQDPNTFHDSGGGQIVRRPGGIVLAILSLVISLGYASMAFDMPGGSISDAGPGLWPRIVGVAWIAISVLAVAESLRSAPTAAADFLPTGSKLKTVGVFSASTVLFIIAIPYLGVYSAACIYASVVIAVLRNRWDWRAFAYGIAAGLATSYIFIELLEVRLTQFPWS